MELCSEPVWLSLCCYHSDATIKDLTILDPVCFKSLKVSPYPLNHKRVLAVLQGNAVFHIKT